MDRQTHYARSGDVHIAYQVVGDGPLDMIYVPPFLTHVEILWEEPSVERFLMRQAEIGRLILFDRRGSGLSDPVTGAPTLEEQTDDVRAVMDAVGSERAALFAQAESTSMAALFAASFPERTSHLILYAPMAKATRSDEIPWAHTPEERAQMVELMAEAWGKGQGDIQIAPSLNEHAGFQAWFGKLQRYAASPGAMRSIMDLIAQYDVCHVYPTIRVPTLIIRRQGDELVKREHSLYLADKIPDAKLVELPGDENFIAAGDHDAVLEEIEEFLTGGRRMRVPDRILATVLFTDIVDSTTRAAELGDRRWRELLGSHDSAVRRQLDRFQGREIKQVGDGFLATFDGPARALRCARAIVDSVGQLGIDVRAGLHTGEVEVIGDDVGGLAVHIGARVSASAGPREVLVSSTVKDLVVGSGIEFEDRGRHALKGVPGEWQLFAVNGA